MPPPAEAFEGREDEEIPSDGEREAIAVANSEEDLGEMEVDVVDGVPRLAQARLSEGPIHWCTF